MRILTAVFILALNPSLGFAQADTIKTSDDLNRTGKSEFERLRPEIKKTLGVEKIDERRKYYNGLRDYRQTLIRLSVSLRNEIDKGKIDLSSTEKSLEDQRKKYRAILTEDAEIDEPSYLYSDVSSKVDGFIAPIEVRVAEIGKSMEKAYDDISRLRQTQTTPDLSPEQRANNERMIRTLNEQAESLRMSRLRQLRRVEPLKQLPSLSKVILETEKSVTSLRNDKSSIERASDDLTDLLNRVDDKIQTLLSEDDQLAYYQTVMTSFFAALVGLVILGFFVIAFTSDQVKAAIFSGESGIQFVTLFSLVIAIILFGILKILEGKELAALLGGLSGYILGRGSNQRNSSPPAPAPVV